MYLWFVGQPQVKHVLVIRWQLRWVIKNVDRLVSWFIICMKFELKTKIDNGIKMKISIKLKYNSRRTLIEPCISNSWDINIKLKYFS